MTFRETYDAVYVRDAAAAEFRAALQQIMQLPDDLYACWREYVAARNGDHDA